MMGAGRPLRTPPLTPRRKATANQSWRQSLFTGSLQATPPGVVRSVCDTGLTWSVSTPLPARNSTGMSGSVFRALYVSFPLPRALSGLAAE